MLHKIDNSNISLLCGASIVDCKPALAFREERYKFIEQLAKLVLKNSKNFNPEINAWAFNFRAINRSDRHVSRRGRGLCFQIAPSNTPISALYSTMYSYLAGNSNIVRFSKKSSGELQYLFTLMNEHFNRGWELHRNYFSFISYDVDLNPIGNEITGELSMAANVRVIWGGDETISAIKMLKTRPDCFDLVFPDKYSISVIDNHALMNASSAEFDELAKKFAYDAMYFEQNACSSPKMLFWVGGSEDVAGDIFWNRVSSLIEKHIKRDVVDQFRAYESSAYLRCTVDGAKWKEYGQISVFEIIGPVSFSQEFDLLIKNLAYGNFLSIQIKNFHELNKFISKKIQTISYFGFNVGIFHEFINTEGIQFPERIVKIGSALNMGSVWDGVDFIETLSKIIDIE